MKTLPLSPIEHVSINERAYWALRESILRQTFAPGEQLDLDQLELTLGVSRTPLRHALARLDLDGLIRINPRRGTYVAELNPDDVAARFDMRRILEIGSADQAIDRMTPEGLDCMRQISLRLETLVTSDGECSDYESYVAGDREFHETFIGFVGNKILSETYERLNVHLYVVRVYYAGSDKRLGRVNQEHAQLLRVIEKRDLAAVRQAIGDHMDKSKQDILRRMRSVAEAKG